MQELHTSLKQSLKRANLAQEYCIWMEISLEKSVSFSAYYKLSWILRFTFLFLEENP